MPQINQNSYTRLDENKTSFFHDFGKISSQFLAWLWKWVCDALTLLFNVTVDKVKPLFKFVSDVAATVLYVLNTPYRVCMGWLFGKIILPAQHLYQRYASDSSSRLYCRITGQKYPKTLVFFMHGNAASIEPHTDYDYVNELDDQLRTQLGGSYRLIAFDPPGVNNNTIVYSQEQIISRSYEFVMDHMTFEGMIPSGRDFMDNDGVTRLCDGKKVVLVGWSLGGATLTQVANRLHENGIAVKCLADRSFTNLPDVAIGKMSRLTGFQFDCMPMTFARGVVSQLLYHSFGEMDAGSAAMTLNHNAPGSMHTIRLSSLDSDEIIPEHASLSRLVDESCQHTLPSTGIQGHNSLDPYYVAEVIGKMCQ